MEDILIVGAGAHVHVVEQLIKEKNEYNIIGYIDDNPNDEKRNIIGNDDDLEKIFNQGIHYAFVAIGNNSIRKKCIEKVENIGYTIPTFISHNACIADDVQIGYGTMVMPGAIVNAGAQIGNGCIINTNSSVDHDDIIDDYVHIAPGVAVSGSTKIGKCTFLGTGCRVIDKISIGNNVIVGAGAVVINNIEDDVTVVGVPARVK